MNSKALAHILNALMPIMVNGINPANKKMRERSTQVLENFFFKSLDIIKPNVFMEIGAHEASASCRIALQDYCEAVYAFEANPYTYKAFKDKNSSLSGGKIEYIHSAISDRHGDVEMMIPVKDGLMPGHASLLARTNPEEYETLSVPCTTLDHYFIQKMSPSDSVAIWIDVEGLTYEVLSGGKRILEKTKILYVEVDERQHWLKQKLSFDVIDLLLKNEFLPLARDRGADQYNIIFVRYGIEEVLKNAQIQFLHESMTLSDNALFSEE